MAKVFIEESTLTNIGNSIRAKKGTTALIDPAKFSTEIDSIVAGGGGGELEVPAEQLTLTGDLSYKFYKGTWNWFLDKYSNYMSTSNVTYTTSMFTENNNIKKVPFEINFRDDCLFANSMFTYASWLEEPSKININFTKPTSYSSFNIMSMFSACERVRNLDNVFDADAIENALSGFVAGTSGSSHPKYNSLFSGCKSLRTAPPWYFKLRTSSEGLSYPSTNYCIYYASFSNCNALDEINNMIVLNYNAAQTSNMFYNFVYNCQRLKNLTFELNNGVPYIVNWKGQTIDLTGSVGYGTNAKGYNSGITTDKEVKNVDTYNALKNDPDWYTSDGRFSRYDHDSAVATINSLPDTSAYLATAGGTNIIKFKGGAGELTDGGAINTLTEEEIAVATAKGWTVTLA